jgi:flagellar hook-associated protein 2
MATTVVSNSSAPNAVMALGTGSGIDIKSLAENLVNAEKQPKAELIQKSINKSEARITGYEVVSRAVTQIKDALDALAQPTTFATFDASSSQASLVTISGSATADVGTHEIEVTQLALAQRSIGTGVGAPLVLGTEAGTGAAAIEIKIGIPPPAGQNAADLRTVLSASAANTKPETIVKAINDMGWPVKASLVQMTGAAGGEVRIVLTGETGGANQFAVTITDGNAGPSLVGFSATQAAQDAILTVNGVSSIQRSTNAIDGVIPGATLTLSGVTQPNTPVVVGLSRNAGAAKDAIKQLVTTYNDLQAVIDAALDPDSSVEKLGGSLVGDNTIRGIRDRIRSILVPPNGSSAGVVTLNGITSNYPASGSSRYSGLRDLGIMLDVDGKMKFSTLKEFDPLNPSAQLLKVGDESQLNAALTGASFSEVAALFQGKDTKPGIARDMSDLISGNGRYVDTSFTPSSPLKLITATQRNARGYLESDKERMVALEGRMKTLLERYLKQFAVMDSLVGESKSVRAGVENSFKSMSGDRR